MMFGTAALPHILMRYYTTPSVQQARVSVFWSLFFIFLLYFTAPCLAVLAKYDMYTNLVGSQFASLPGWAAAWAKVDPGLLNITDINKDGIVQWAEMVIGGDLIVLATPEIAGLPYVVSGLVAAGGLAAALSTADGLLLTIANALSHDLYYKMIDPIASTTKRVTISKVLLICRGDRAAYVTSLKPGDILFLVGAAFSLAASAFFPPLVLGVFWKRANKWGAIIGMVAGLAVCVYYMMRTYPFFTNMGVPKMDLWFGLSPISAGVFGLPVGLVTIWIVSLLTPAPSQGSAGTGGARALPAPEGRQRSERSALSYARSGKGPPRRALFIYTTRSLTRCARSLRPESTISRRVMRGSKRSRCMTACSKRSVLPVTCSAMPSCVPGMRIHGLQFCSLLERGRRFCVLPERGMREAEAVPGAVQARPQARRFAERSNGLAHGGCACRA